MISSIFATILGLYASVSMFIGGFFIQAEPQNIGAPVSNIFRNILPETTQTYDLGSTTPAAEWKNIYTQNITISGTCTGCSGFAYLFPSNATSTKIEFNGGLTAFASSTIGAGTQDTGLTIFGGATSTGNVYLGTNTLTAHALRSDASDGVLIESANGTDVGLFGAGNTANALFYGGVNIDGATRLATSLTGILKATSGSVSVATAGVDYSNFAYPFALADNATSTLTQFNGGLTAYATSTIGDGTQIGGLTISGGATTSLSHYIGGSLGIGTTSPSSILSVSGTSGLFVTNTGASYTTYIEDIADDTTPFVIDATGRVGIGTSTPDTQLTINGSGATLLKLQRDSGTDANTGLVFDGLTTDFYMGHNGTNFAIDDDATMSSLPLLTLTSAGLFAVNATTPEGTIEGQGDEASDASLVLDADQGDDTTDTWFIKSLAADNGLSFTNHTSELLRITSTGNVGIGTTSPNAYLDIATATNGSTNEYGTLRLGLASAVDGGAKGFYSIGRRNTDGFLSLRGWQNNASGYRFSTNTGGTDTERLTILNGGNVGISTTSPFTKLGVVGTITADNINATSTTATSVFSGILQVVTRFIGVIAAAFTPSVEGECGLDTTDSQYKCYSGGAVRVYSPNVESAFVLATSTMGTGTTTIKVSGFPSATTFAKFGCTSSGSGTFVAVLGDSAASTTPVVSGTSLTTTFTTMSSNNAFTAGETLWFAIGSVSGTVVNPSCSYQRTIDAT